MKTEDELKEKIASLKAMGSPSALSKARELEWVMGIEEEPDVESDMIVDALMKGIDPTPEDLWKELPEFARRDQMLYTFSKQKEAVTKPKDWNEAWGTWNEEIAKAQKKTEEEFGKAFSWRDLIGADGFAELKKATKKAWKTSNGKKLDQTVYDGGFYTKIPDKAADIETAELIASLTPNGGHRPLLDLDLPAVVIPSTTPGHGHLYIDKVLSWKEYQKLLNCLADLGIIENGYRGASLARGYSALRLPWIKKVKDEKEITPGPWAR